MKRFILSTMALLTLTGGLLMTTAQPASADGWWGYRTTRVYSDPYPYGYGYRRGYSAGYRAGYNTGTDLWGSGYYGPYEPYYVNQYDASMTNQTGLPYANGAPLVIPYDWIY